MEGTTIKEWTKGKLSYRTFYGYDDAPDISWLEQNYHADKSLTKAQADEYTKQDKARLEAYYNDEWHMVYVGCEIRATTSTNWAEAPLVGRAYLHGIESDAGDYINQVADELVGEAEADMDALKQVMCGQG